MKYIIPTPKVSTETPSPRIADIIEHSDYIYKVAYRFTQDPIDAEDLKQDVILNLLENPHQFRGKAKLTTFLYSVIKYRFYYTKRLHINSRTRATHFDDSQGFTPITTDNPESIALHAEQRQIVQTAIANLKDSYKQILTMREYDELSYDEIADQLDISIDNVKFRLHTARQALKKAIAP